MVYCVYSLESPRWGDSNENTQHTSKLKKIEKDIHILHPDMALWWILISSNYPYLEHHFMVPKVFEPLKFDYKCLMKIQSERMQFKGKQLFLLFMFACRLNGINSKLKNWLLRSRRDKHYDNYLGVPIFRLFYIIYWCRPVPQCQLFQNSKTFFSSSFYFCERERSWTDCRIWIYYEDILSWRGKRKQETMASLGFQKKEIKLIFKQRRSRGESL